MRAIHALAVLMGLSFLLYSDLGAPDWMLWVFLLFFVVGLLIAVAAHRRDWHRKYIDYRALAEGLRVQSFWRRAGLSMTGDPEFAHDNFMQKQDVELGWIRNVMRQVGLLPLPPKRRSGAGGGCGHRGVGGPARAVRAAGLLRAQGRAARAPSPAHAGAGAGLPVGRHRHQPVPGVVPWRPGRRHRATCW